MYKNIVTLKARRTQILICGVDEVNYDCYRIADNDEIHIFPKIFNIAKNEVQYHADKENEPHIIGNYEKFAERYDVVKGNIYSVKRKRKYSFEKKEHNSVYRPEKKQEQVGKFRRFQF